MINFQIIVHEENIKSCSFNFLAKMNFLKMSKPAVISCEAAFVKNIP